MYGLRITDFASARECELSALWHAGRSRREIDGWAGRLEWQCCRARECWHSTAGWTVGAGTAAAIPSSLPVTGGATAAARPGVGCGGKWNAGTGNICPGTASTPATSSQSPLRLSYSRNLCLRGWPLTSAGLLPGNGAIGRHFYGEQYPYSHSRNLDGGCNAFACWLALTHRCYLSRTALYYQCADEQRATFCITTCPARHKLQSESKAVCGLQCQ